VGNVLLGAAIWRSGVLPRWADPLGSRGRGGVPAGPCVRDDDRRPEHPTNGAAGRRVAVGDRRGVDGLECDAQTFETASRGRRPAQGTVTPAEQTSTNFEHRKPGFRERSF
jgi:hypothetical protein